LGVKMHHAEYKLRSDVNDLIVLLSQTSDEK